MVHRFAGVICSVFGCSSACRVWVRGLHGGDLGLSIATVSVGWWGDLLGRGARIGHLGRDRAMQPVSTRISHHVCCSVSGVTCVPCASLVLGRWPLLSLSCVKRLAGCLTGVCVFGSLCSFSVWGFESSAMYQLVSSLKSRVSYHGIATRV